MSQKVLVISASPRKSGNLDTLCDEFIRGVQESGNEAEKVFMRDKKICDCTGCSTFNSAYRCAHQDDMAAILDKMVVADVIVLATPIYFYTMDGQMKTLIDRTVPRYTEITNKDFYFIVTVADTDQVTTKCAISGFRCFAEDCLPNLHEKGIIYSIGVWQISEIKNNPVMRQVYEMGKQV